MSDNQTVPFSGDDPGEQGYGESGATESSFGNGIFVNLRAGWIAKTSNKPVEGWKKFTNENAAGEKFDFWAQVFGDITGFVKDMKWHEKQFPTGTVRGWWIIIDVNGLDYILDIKTTDRPFHRTMATLLACDFTKRVKFSGFMGKARNGGKPQKVLLLYQGARKADDPEKEQSVQPLYAERWLSLDIVAKAKARKELTDQEKKNIAYNADGSINGDYPYIRQNEDKSWNFDNWTNFLIRKMKEEVIPNVQAAQAARDAAKSGVSEGPNIPDYSGPSDETPSGPPDDSDIPF